MEIKIKDSTLCNAMTAVCLFTAILSWVNEGDFVGSLGWVSSALFWNILKDFAEEKK